MPGTYHAYICTAEQPDIPIQPVACSIGHEQLFLVCMDKESASKKDIDRWMGKNIKSKRFISPGEWGCATGILRRHIDYSGNENPGTSNHFPANQTTSSTQIRCMTARCVRQAVESWREDVGSPGRVRPRLLPLGRIDENDSGGYSACQRIREK